MGQTVHLAGERGLLADRAVILDAPHTLSRYTASSAKVALEGRYRRLLSTLRDSVALTGKGLPVPLPGDSAGETLEEVRTRCLALVKLTRSLPVTSSLPRVNERLNVLEETLQDVKRSGVISRDRDARVGHKSRHKSFFGYKTHVAMTKNGIITGGGSDHGREGGRSIPAIAGGAESTKRRGGGNRHRRHGLLRSG